MSCRDELEASGCHCDSVGQLVPVKRRRSSQPLPLPERDLGNKSDIKYNQVHVTHLFKALQKFLFCVT